LTSKVRVFLAKARQSSEFAPAFKPFSIYVF